MTMIRTFTGEKPATKLPKGTIDSHMHMYLAGFPAIAGGPPLPAGDLPGPDEYRKVMEWLGIDRVVITQGNAHQADNSNVLAALAEMGDIARGVAVINSTTSEAEIARLADAGVVGTRLMDLPGGAVGMDELEAVDSRAADANWVSVVQFDGNRICDLEPRLAKMKSRWVLDHHGKFFAGATEADVAAMKRLIDGGNCWLKFCGCYESSLSGAPNFEDIGKIARDMAAHAPERIIWGTNWPHNGAKTTEDYPDDRALTDTVLSWLPSDEARHKVLVETPEALFGFPPM
ncbi:amidohydrolase family protein [Falsirhodobacter sp. alg1]|uniref:amidohydrolase family protein n=1 Tax=Falsirhodobacter sp. alg1 TaxID=1472418 RepID=UPI000AAE843F|nr:amidohydrolase family protein [Falsirhodobacter sp. alg1]